LGAEADAEHRPPRRERALDQRALGGEEGMPVRLVRRHRAAEHDEAANGAQVARQRLATRQIQVAVVNPEITQRVGEQPEPFGGGVAEHQPGRPLTRGVLPAPAYHGSLFAEPAPPVKPRSDALRAPPPAGGVSLEAGWRL